MALLWIPLAAAAAWGIVHLLRIAPVGAGYKAKALCTAVFASGREPADVLAADVSADSYRVMRLFRARIDRSRRTATCSLMGLRPRTAAYRPGLGATLAIGAAPEDLRPRELTPPRGGADWPGGPPAEASPALRRVLEAAFEEPDPRRLRRTRAVVVVRDGRVVGERYAPGFGPGMPLPGWSMTKSVFSGVIGILAGRGRLRLDQDRLLPEWSGAGDPRGKITLEDLLRMRSGLRWREVYTDPLEDVTQMLFNRGDAAGFAAAKPLEVPPGTAWRYASGTTNILARVARLAVGGAHEDYLSFPRRELFEPIGAASALLEPCAAGDFVPSSFMLAAARDWARLGWLYAADGVWGARRVLPEGWVAFSRTPTPQSPEGRYGAHWWLKVPPELGGRTEAAARVPADAFHAVGHEGQVISVIPSRGLVAVRLGLSIYIDAWDHAAFLAAVLDAL